ncbi:polymorphic toxin type 50 domain-containing protein [Fusobacterium massiliense]|uniref:polymorphic toxin type 50 domain-containing protein n=1 Tax=Fusobacterium massiliense TaxID=1852365 RepID=UPI0028D7FCC4|nr:polymorphic toxin type 50 domain-containing protein [Fusobacterium massiliense]
MNTYDEGYLGEETSLYTRSKLEPDDKTKVFSEADKEKYLESLRTKYPNTKSLEEQYAEAKLVPDKDREHFYDLVSDFIISSDYAGNDRVLLDDTSKEKLKKYGNNIYYDGYRVVGISKDGWAQLDFNDTLPNENEIVLIAGISRLISHPIKTISNIKNEIKLITNNGKEVIQEIGENDLKKLVDDTPTIKLIDNITKGNTGNSLKNFNLDDLKKLKHNVHATEKHIKGTTYYNQEVAKGVEKSYFYSNVGTGDIEKIFIDAIDNGEIVEAKRGGIRIFIDTGKPVGMVLDDGVWKSTIKIQFHAGKKGFHGVPYIGEKGVKK